MLISTLAPTLAHLVVATFSMVALPFFGLIDVPLPRWINSPDHTTAMLAPLTLGTAATVSLILPLLLFYVLWVWAAHSWPGLTQGYLALFEGLARMVGAL